MSGPIGNWTSDLVASGQTGEAYRALKLPGRHDLKWKDGYPEVKYQPVRAGEYVASVGGIVFATITMFGDGMWRWNWQTNDQLYPVRASGGATKLEYARNQIADVIAYICGTKRPE